MVHDQLRQSQYEMFCGLSKEKYFPSLARPVLELISDFPSFVISSANPEITVPQEIIQGHNVCWTAPVDPTTGKSTAEATIMLRAPAEVREIAVTFGPNADPAMDPCTLEVSVGAYLNALHPVYNGLPLPSPAAPCTQLIYPVPPSLWDIYDETYLKGDEQNNHSHKRSIVRFVKVVLCGPGKEPLCIGKIDVFGTIPRPERTPEDTRQTLKAQEIEGNARALVSLLKTATLLERHSTTSEAMVTQKHASPALDTLTPEPCEADIDDDIPAGAEEDNDDNDNDSDETAEQDKGGDAERLRIAQAEVQRLREEFELQSSPEHLSQTFFGNVDFTGTTPNRMESCLRDYEEAVRALVAGGKAPTYTGVLELELTRLNLKITSAERDTIIALAGRKSQDLSPAHFRYLRDEKLEDALYQTSPNPQRCRCGEGFKLFSRNYTKCAYCREKLCPACMHPKPFPVPQFCWDTPHRVCKSCAADILYQRDFTNKIQAIYDFNEQDIARRSPRSFSDGLFTQVQAAVPEVALTQVSNSECCCCLLSAFPGAGFAGEVPCADGSSPAEVLLVSDDLISSSSAFWAAPCDSARSVRLTVCLPQKSAVSSVTVFPPSYEGECCDDMPALSAEVVESPLMVGGSASTNSKTALAKAGAAMSCEFPTPPLGCAVIITASLPQDGRKDAQIRLGKIAVHGKFVYDTDEPKKAKLISDLPQDALRKKSTVNKYIFFNYVQIHITYIL